MTVYLSNKPTRLNVSYKCKEVIKNWILKNLLCFVWLQYKWETEKNRKYTAAYCSPVQYLVFQLKYEKLQAKYIKQTLGSKTTHVPHKQLTKIWAPTREQLTP